MATDEYRAYMGVFTHGDMILSNINSVLHKVLHKLLRIINKWRIKNEI